MRKLVIILDPAHGEEVPGKGSPDGTHKEYKWSREICEKLKTHLTCLGFRVEITNPTDKEIGLSRRKEFASKVNTNPGEFKFLVSPHNNAAGMGNDWANARGFEIYTSPRNTTSDKFAKVILDNLAKDFPSYKNRGTKEANFTVLMGSGYSAVLIEWLFQDNKEDVKLLQDETTNNKFMDSLVSSFLYINDHLI